ncbi:MAG: hypothetical protein MJZ92_01205, partial [Paludibacteraceae bacterium]|nr:hypothetical protein [Paludibacteraceae bacterium]
NFELREMHQKIATFGDKVIKAEKTTILYSSYTHRILIAHLYLRDKMIVGRTPSKDKDSRKGKQIRL